VSERIVLEGAQVYASQRLNRLDGGGSLDGQQRVTRACIYGNDVAGILDLIGDPTVVARDSSRVHDEQEVLWSKPIQQHIVNKRAGVRQNRRILYATHTDLRDVVGGDPLQCGQRVLARDLDFSHVADVEQPRPCANGHVLFRDATILERHLPAAVRHHSRSGSAMTGVERGLLEGRCCGLFHAAGRTSQ
jgi:hypothetical protein